MNADLSNVDGEWFYEDSVTVEVLDVQLYGAAASVMGVVHFYNFGEAGHRSFHGTVVRDGDRVRWDRWFHQDHGQLARSYIPIESEVEGAEALSNSMLWMSLQADGNAAGALSDSLLEVDPTMAMAHVGQLWRLVPERRRGVEYKCEGAVDKATDPATKYYLMSHSEDFGDQLENARIAHNLAPDSPSTKSTSLQLMGKDAAAARILLERATER